VVTFPSWQTQWRYFPFSIGPSYPRLMYRSVQCRVRPNGNGVGVGFGPELEDDGLEHAPTKKASAVAAMAAPKRTLLKTVPGPGGYMKGGTAPHIPQRYGVHLGSGREGFLPRLAVSIPPGMVDFGFAGTILRASYGPILQ